MSMVLSYRRSGVKVVRRWGLLVCGFCGFLCIGRYCLVVGKGKGKELTGPDDFEYEWLWMAGGVVCLLFPIPHACMTT